MDQSSRYSKLFTVNEANELLPALRPLVEQILETIRRLKSASEAVIRREQLDAEAPDLMERLRQDDGVRRLIGDLQGFVEQVNSHGCVCKGIEQGLIDFPCVLGSEVVFLCWQLGEAQVGYWHRIEDGFAGRKPLLDQDADEDDKLSYH